MYFGIGWPQSALATRRGILSAARTVLDYRKYIWEQANSTDGLSWGGGGWAKIYQPRVQERAVDIGGGAVIQGHLVESELNDSLVDGQKRQIVGLVNPQLLHKAGLVVVDRAGREIEGLGAL
jgi:hypothetical protein